MGGFSSNRGVWGATTSFPGLFEVFLGAGGGEGDEESKSPIPIRRGCVFCAPESILVRGWVSR